MPREMSHKELATRIRAHALRMTHRSSASHVATSLSVADLLSVLYTTVLRVDPSCPAWAERDRFVLSKGHGCAALYAALAERGFFPPEWLETYCQNGAQLPGHVTHRGIPGVEVSTGSLGHGLPIGCGMALAAKRDALVHRVFVLLSDGDCDEGSTWEAALFAPQHRLDNLVAIVDHNKLQALGRVKDVLDLAPLAAKWQAFGWATEEIDGHDATEIAEVLRRVPFELGRPSCVIAHTVKGKGVSFMEDQLAWHYRSPNAQQLRQALEELGVNY